ncbi:MAG: sigma-54-dependent Fis family transcriptional regulator [Nitrospirae bacterium]|nr:sigma-54-dependent Fis family transcriptional regulator [Nitrospirota bacterium]
MSEPVILVVDDEAGIRESLSDILKDEGYRVLLSESAESAIPAIREQPLDIVFLDIWLPGMDGIEALAEIRSINRELPVIMISGHGNIELAVKAVKMGAYDFLEKPLSLEKVTLTAKRALEKKRLEAENKALRESLMEKHRLVGESTAIKALLSQIEIVSKTKSTVLIFGESGTGKELTARLIHELSPRAKMPFVEVNCAAIPHELIESELFGHEKGSFTGAFEKKKGKFEVSDGGTLFLDEIGDMSPETQAKVLRALETQEFQRVGGSKNIKVDLRVIAATNKDLKEEVKKGTFREDLYFRLNVIPISIPPLRERKEDISLLVKYFLETIAKEYGKPPKKISEPALKSLMEQHWHGNVRELKNTIERLVIMTSGDVIEGKDILFPETLRTDYLTHKNLKKAKDAFEKDFLLNQLAQNNWNVSKTADALGIERSNLHRKIKTLGINPDPSG